MGRLRPTWSPLSRSLCHLDRISNRFPNLIDALLIVVSGDREAFLCQRREPIAFGPVLIGSLCEREDGGLSDAIRHRTARGVDHSGTQRFRITLLSDVLRFDVVQRSVDSLIQTVDE